jgi:hypothetical protein
MEIEEEEEKIGIEGEEKEEEERDREEILREKAEDERLMKLMTKEEREFVELDDLEGVEEEASEEYVDQSSFLADVVGLPIDVFTRLTFEFFNHLMDTTTNQMHPEYNEGIAGAYEILERWSEAVTKLFVTGNDKKDRMNGSEINSILFRVINIFEKFGVEMAKKTAESKIEDKRTAMTDATKSIDIELDKLSRLLRSIDNDNPPEDPISASMLINYNNIIVKTKVAMESVLTELLLVSTDVNEIKGAKHRITISKVLSDLGKTWDLEAVLFNVDLQRRERYKLEKELDENIPLQRIIRKAFSPDNGDLVELEYIDTKRISNAISTGKEEKTIFARVDMKGGKNSKGAYIGVDLGKYSGTVFLKSLDRPSNKSEWFDMAEIKVTYLKKERTIWVKGDGYWCSLANHKWRYPGSYDVTTMPSDLHPYFSCMEMKSDGAMQLLRNISKGEEIFSDYGPDYWENFGISPQWNLKGIRPLSIPKPFLLPIAELIEKSDITGGRDEADEIIELAKVHLSEINDPNNRLNNNLSKDRQILRMQDVKHLADDIGKIDAIGADDSYSSGAIRTGHELDGSKSVQEALRGDMVNQQRGKLLETLNRYPTIGYSIFVEESVFDTPEKQLERISIRQKLRDDFITNSEKRIKARKISLDKFKSDRVITDEDFTYEDMVEILEEEEIEQQKEVALEIKEKRKREKEEKKELTLKEKEEKIQRKIEKERLREEAKIQKQEEIERKRKKKEKKKENATDYTKLLKEKASDLGLTADTAVQYKKKRTRLREYINRFRILWSVYKSLPEILLRRVENLVKIFRGKYADIRIPSDRIDENEYYQNLIASLKQSGEQDYYKNVVVSLQNYDEEDYYQKILKSNPLVYRDATNVAIFYWTLLRFDITFIEKFGTAETGKKSTSQTVKELSKFLTEEKNLSGIKELAVSIDDDLKKFSIIGLSNLEKILSVLTTLEDCIAVAWNHANPDIGKNMYELLIQTVVAEESEMKLKKAKNIKERRIVDVSNILETQPSSVTLTSTTPTSTQLAPVEYISFNTPIRTEPESELSSTFQFTPKEPVGFLDLSPIRTSPSDAKFVLTIDEAKIPSMDTTNELEKTELQLIKTLPTKKRKMAQGPVMKSQDSTGGSLVSSTNINAPIMRTTIKDKTTKDFYKLLVGKYIGSASELNVVVLKEGSGTLRALYHMAELTSLGADSSLLEIGFGDGGLTLLAIREIGVARITAVDWKGENDKSHEERHRLNHQVNVDMKAKFPEIVENFTYLKLDSISNVIMTEASHLFMHWRWRASDAISRKQMSELAVKFNSSKKTKYIGCFYNPKEMEGFEFQVKQIQIQKNGRLGYFHAGTNDLYVTFYIYQKFKVNVEDPKASLTVGSLVSEGPARKKIKSVPFSLEEMTPQQYQLFLQRNEESKEEMSEEEMNLAQSQFTRFLGGLGDLTAADSSRQRLLMGQRRKNLDDIDEKQKKMKKSGISSMESDLLESQIKALRERVKDLNYLIFEERRNTLAKMKTSKKKLDKIDALNKDIVKHMHDFKINAVNDPLEFPKYETLTYEIALLRQNTSVEIAKQEELALEKQQQKTESSKQQQTRFSASTVQASVHGAKLSFRVDPIYSVEAGRKEFPKDIEEQIGPKTELDILMDFLKYDSLTKDYYYKYRSAIIDMKKSMLGLISNHKDLIRLKMLSFGDIIELYKTYPIIEADNLPVDDPKLMEELRKFPVGYMNPGDRYFLIKGVLLNHERGDEETKRVISERGKYLTLLVDFIEGKNTSPTLPREIFIIAEYIALSIIAFEKNHL